MVRKKDFNYKFTEVECKISDVKNFATKADRSSTESKISYVRNLIRKTKFDTDLKALEDKIPDVSRLVKKLIMLQKLVKLKIIMSLRQHYIIDIKI